MDVQSEALANAVAQGITKALGVHPTIIPRRMTERVAATYLGRSFFWLRNLRKQDKERVAEGGIARGPLPIFEGRTPFYLREELDGWLDAGGLGGA